VDIGRKKLIGYLCALGAGTLWGTTGPLSTALYAQGAQITAIGFWRIALATVAFGLYGLLRREVFATDGRTFLLAAVGGGGLVALFEVAYQFGIAGAGVAGAAALLYTAPVMVALLADPLLGEKLTPTRLVLAVVVGVGAALTVRGGQHEPAAGAGSPSLVAGVAGGLAAAAAYAGTTVLARFLVPRIGSVRFLVLEIAGGSLWLAVVLPLAGRPPAVPASLASWGYVVALAVGTVWAANMLFFGGVKRIEAAPTAVAATIEPVVGALLALALFGQRLSPSGWLGLAMVVGGVAAGYAREAVGGDRA
jgi:DME family drug/metabolite transporter